MKGDNTDATVMIQKLWDKRKRVFDLAEFVIYYNPDSLENFGSRVVPKIAVNPSSNKIGELLGTLDRTVMDDNSGKHGSGAFLLFAVLHKNLC
jgi:hypothetical protein